MFILSVIILTTFYAFICSDSSVNYGKCDMYANSAISCIGPKHKDCARFIVHVLPGGKTILVLIEAFEDAKVETFRLSAQKTGIEKDIPPIISLHLNKPCNQIYIGDIIARLVGSKSCLIKKGKYNYTVDISTFTEKFWAGQFFYGIFTFRSLLYNSRCNFACNEFNITLSPKH